MEANQRVAEKASASFSLLDQIMEQTRLEPTQEGYAVARQGVAEFISEMLRSTDRESPVNKRLVDQMVAELDHKIGQQMDAILHHPDVQQLESAWRGLSLLVDRTDFRENIKIEFIHITKDELLDDFEASADVTQSGFYKHVYSSGYGQFGGEPIAAVIGNYYFGPSTPDMKLLNYVASVGAMAHAPFIAAAAPQFFGVEGFQELPNLKEVKDIFDGPRYAKWRSLRESEDSRYLGLAMPRFLLRQPYDPLDNPARTFQYTERVQASHENYLWGNAAYLMATRITESFAKYRWCPNIIGPQSGGAVEDLPVHLYEALGQVQAKIPTEVLVTDRREFELAEEGSGIGRSLLHASLQQQLQAAQRIREAFFNGSGGMGLQFNVQPLALSSLDRNSVLNVDGQLVGYAHGPSAPSGLIWPNTLRDGVESKLTLVDSTGRTRSLRFAGQWSWFRLLSQAQLNGATANSVDLSFLLGESKVRYRIVADKAVNPFTQRLFKDFALPRTLAAPVEPAPSEAAMPAVMLPAGTSTGKTVTPAVVR